MNLLGSKKISAQHLLDVGFLRLIRGFSGFVEGGFINIFLFKGFL